MFEQFAAVARTIGSAHRLELLELLAQTERSVEELAGLGGLTIANAPTSCRHSASSLEMLAAVALTFMTGR
jgi:ArsR family transcriptional regulator